MYKALKTMDCLNNRKAQSVNRYGIKLMEAIDSYAHMHVKFYQMIPSSIDILQVWTTNVNDPSESRNMHKNKIDFK